MAAHRCEAPVPGPEQPGSHHQTPAGSSAALQVVARGLPTAAKLPAVWTHFSRFGKVASVDFDFEQGGDGQFTGSAFITFVLAQSAKTALESSGKHTLDGSVVECISVPAFEVEKKLEGSAEIRAQWDAFCNAQGLPSCSPRDCGDVHLRHFLWTKSKKRSLKAAHKEAGSCQSATGKLQAGEDGGSHRGEQKGGHCSELRAGGRRPLNALPPMAEAITRSQAVDVPGPHRKCRRQAEAGGKQAVDDSSEGDRRAAELGVKEPQRHGAKAEAGVSKIATTALRLLRTINRPIPAGLLDARLAAEDSEGFVSARGSLPQSVTLVESLLDDSVVKRFLIHGHLCVEAR